MRSFVLYLMVVHILNECTIVGFTLKHTMDRLTYVEDRLNAESKIRKDDFNALFQKLETMETMLHKALEEKHITAYSVDTGIIQEQLPHSSDDKVKRILKAFKMEKAENHRFRREIAEDMTKQNELAIKAHERIEQRLSDIAELLELLKEEAKTHELMTSKASAQLQKVVEENIQSLLPLVNITKQTSANMSLNFVGIRESLTEQVNIITKSLQSSTNDIKETCQHVTNVVAKTTDIPIRKYTSCLELYRNGIRKSGVYEILVDALQSPEKVVSVYCDMTTDNGGWTVFQRRQDGSEDFFRDWNDYKHGFGSLDGEFWLGNEYINLLTDDGETHELRIDLEDYSGDRRYAKYSEFKVSTEHVNYRLMVRGYTGDAGDSLHQSDYVHDGMGFTTKDRDNDRYSGNCAQHGNGAWWYNSCFASNLNSLYVRESSCREVTRCIAWSSWGTHRHNLKFTEMKFR